MKLLLKILESLHYKKIKRYQMLYLLEITLLYLKMATKLFWIKAKQFMPFLTKIRIILF